MWSSFGEGRRPVAPLVFKASLGAVRSLEGSTPSLLRHETSKNMPYIIGTAGHIDHGKTSLIKALTGEDTDRLKEEKERGISIDLGFAHFDLPDGSRAGIVDVPGHERFIRNMLAGAHGIDLALFTVAADDGIMPQTEEHLDILHLLGVQRAIFVITKVDLVTEARIREVEDDIRILISGTSLENSPIVPFSFITGSGLAQLRDKIAEMLLTGKKTQSPGYFRLPVDRVFALQGHGLIVTGTALRGEVHTGDRVHCLPGNESFRVRSIQVHDQPVDTGLWGQRVALNLSGAEGAALARGHVICHESITRTSDRFDAFLEVRPAAGSGVKNHQRVRVHLGTAERFAKLILLGASEKVGPKESAYCQLTVSEPLLVMRGDRFIIRDETSSRTLGGGVVIHPWARKHKRGEAGLLERLKLLHTGELASVVAAFVDESVEFAVTPSSLQEFLNLNEEEFRARVAGLTRIRVMTLEGEKLYTTDRKWDQLRDELLAQLKDHHAAHPLAPGMDMEEARAKLPYEVAPRVFRAFLEQLEAAKSVAREGNFLRLSGHQVRLKGDEQGVVAKIKSALRKTPVAPPDLKQIESEVGVSAAKLREVIRVMEREKSIVRVAPDMYFLAESIDKIRGTLRDHLLKQQQITPAAFRDLLGTSRKYTIPLLEYFDREGITIRAGDARRLRN
jgi:selenocysteine-specific elongation factor